MIVTNISKLRKKSEIFDFNDENNNAEDLVEQLKQEMIDNQGIGISAIQVGIPFRVFLMGDYKDPDNIIPVFNPRIVDTFGEEVYYEEGCISFPGLFVKVKRPAGIRMRYENMYGETRTDKFSGITARIAQHEYDHLEGVIFTQKASRIHLERAKRNAKRINRNRK